MGTWQGEMLHVGEGQSGFRRDTLGEGRDVFFSMLSMITMLDEGQDMVSPPCR